MVVTDSGLLSLSPISAIVNVRQSNIRSIHVVQDLINKTIIDQYLITAQSRSSLHRILDRLFGTSPTRAWTLTGPYGTGKSYFSLILMNLFNSQNSGHQQAMELLASKDPALAKKISEKLQLDSGYGFFTVPVSGSRLSLPECLRNSLQVALQPYIPALPIQSLLKCVETWTASTTAGEIAAWVNELKISFVSAQLPFSGVLFILDEMGKLLEFAAQNPEKTDVYSFQELAEQANRSGDFPMIFVGVLHQAFDRYAALLNGATQREWAKVQGRYEDIAFQEPPALQMRLLAHALESQQNNTIHVQLRDMGKLAENAWACGWQPPLMDQAQFIDLCEKAYPFHPSALMALPYVFRRLAQNERSLFAYLASSEPFGFQEFIHKNAYPATLRLPNLFDYLAANFQARLYASGKARQLTETLEQLQITPNLAPLEVDVLKTVGLINWLAELGAVQATESIIISALVDDGRSDTDIKAVIQRLKERSLLVFRRYNGTFNIWQGSDVDIEERLDAAHQQMSGSTSYAGIIQQFLPQRSVVARRHSYETGTLRYFEIRYVDSTTYQNEILETKNGSAGLVLLALPASQSEVDLFAQWACEDQFIERKQVLVGVAGRTMHLADLAQELRALNWVSENTPELANDPVARRELRARIAGVEAMITRELDENLKLHRLSQAKNCVWFREGKQLDIRGNKGLSHLLSKICDDVYDRSPRIRNELINRNVLSSQAAAARRNLIEGLLTRSDREYLGIEGYPPERSMYETLLRGGGLHIETNGVWSLKNLSHHDPLGLQPIFTAIADVVFTPPVKQTRISDLFEMLTRPPYGLTYGVLPVLFAIFYQLNMSEMTLYREGSLLPEPGIADWEVLIRRPELFAVAGCRVEGELARIVERFSRGVGTTPAVMPVVRSLVKRLKTLPEHAWRTRRLPKEAIALRRLVDTARSPEGLIFHELPVELGLVAFDEVVPDEDTVSLFFDRLNQAMFALGNVTPQLRMRSRDLFLEACGLPAGEVGWHEFCEISTKLVHVSNQQALIPVLTRAADNQSSETTLDSVLACIANRTLRTWTDEDGDRFVTQARALGELFKTERGYYFPSTILDPGQQKRYQQMAGDIQNTLAGQVGDDPQLLEAALQALSRELMVIERRLKEKRENS